MNAQATFKTERGNRYLTALCHHFGRKLESMHDGESGWVRFPFGRCELRSKAGELKLFAAADSQPDLDAVIEVVTNHLERFAFREDPKLEWTAKPNGMAPANRKTRNLKPERGMET